MNLEDITRRKVPADPWSEGENIPWNEPEFSVRMLAEHLSQEHDLASRRSEVIDRQVRWIHEAVLGDQPTRILDLTCGPGLYTSRLARLGHRCTGLDYAPEAIRHAQETAQAEGLDCRYSCADIREADFGSGFGLSMMLFGQINVFPRGDARSILRRSCEALAPGGRLVLEPQRLATVERTGQAGNTWYSRGQEGGLFSGRAHLCLTESFWDPERRSATQRFFIVDAESHEVVRHAMTTEGYEEEELARLLVEVGFGKTTFFPSLVGTEVNEVHQACNFVVIAEKEGRTDADSQHHDLS